MANVMIVGAGATGSLFAARLAEPGSRVTLVGADRERLALIAHEGIALTDDNGTRIICVDAALREHAHHKASMLQDREHGRSTEIEMINGAIGREGARPGVATSVCDTLADLAGIIEHAPEDA